MRLRTIAKCLGVVIVLSIITIHVQLFVQFYHGNDEDEVVVRNCRSEVLVSFAMNTTSEGLLSDWRSMSRTEGRLLAVSRQSKNYMAMGLVINGLTSKDLSSLERTLTLLSNHTTLYERLHHVVLVTLLGDIPDENVDSIVSLIVEEFLFEISIGFVQIIQERAISNVNETPHIHAMLLASRYVSDIAEHYLHIGGTNVDAAVDYVDGIREFVQRETWRRRRGVTWMLLEFGAGGNYKDFVGIFLHSEDLARFATYLYTFDSFGNRTDFLQHTFLEIVSQRVSAMRRPALLRRRENRDEYEADVMLKPWSSPDDPAGTVVTSMYGVGTHTADLVYASGGGFFQSKSPVVGDWIAIVFEVEVSIDHIHVQTGLPSGHLGLSGGILEASPRLLKLDLKTPNVVCADFRHVGEVHAGTNEFYSLQRVLWNRPTRCLRLTVTSTDGADVVFHQIAVYFTN